MKQTFFLLFFISLKLFLFSQEDANLSLNLNVGDKYLIETQLESVTFQEIMGNKTTVKQNYLTSYSIEIFDFPTDSTIQAYLQFKRLKTVDVGPGVKDSTDTNDISLLDSVTQKGIFKLLNDTSIITLKKRGGIITFNQPDVYFKKTNGINENDISFKKVKEYLENYSLLFSLSLINFPKSAVKKEDFWTYNDTLQQPTFFITNSVFELNNILKSEYCISYKSTLNSDVNNDFKIRNAFLNYDISGKMTGEIYFDKTTCMIKSAEYKQNVSGTTIMKYSKDSGPAYSWPIQIQTSINVKVVNNNNNNEK